MWEKSVEILNKNFLQSVEKEKELFKNINNYCSSRIEASILHERSLAHLCNIEISSLLKSINSNSILCEECKIKFIKPYSENELLNFAKSISGCTIFNGIKKKTLKWQNECIPDAFITNFLNDNIDCFIEYKLQKKFNYFDLANDLLKFRILTNDYKRKCVFLYICFKKDINYNVGFIDAVKCHRLKFSLLSIERIPSNCRFFYYYSKNSSNRIIAPQANVIAYTLLNEVQEEVLEISDENVQKQDDLKIYDFISNYGKKILLCNNIKMNIDELYTIFGLLLNFDKEQSAYKQIDDIYKLFFDKNVEKIKKKIKNIDYIIKKLNEKMNINIKKFAKERSLNTTNKTSWYCLALVQYSLELIGIKEKFKQFKTEPKAYEHLIEQLKNIYNKEDIIINGLYILLYIKYSLDECFIIKDREICGETDFFKRKKFFEKINTNLKNVYKIIGIRNYKKILNTSELNDACLKIIEALL